MPSGLDPVPAFGSMGPGSSEATAGTDPRVPSRIPHRRLIRLGEASENPGRFGKVGRAPTWGDLLAAAVAVGAASGVLELSVLLFQTRVLHYVDWTTLMTNRHAVWMIPTTAAALVVPLAMALAAPMLAMAAWRVRRSPGEESPGPAWGWAGMVLGFLLVFGPLVAVRGFHPMAPLALSLGLGFRLRRLVVRPTPAWRRGVRGASAAAVVGLALPGLWGWGAGASVAGPGPASPGRRPPNLLWIVADTLRADRMGLYGYSRPTTPALDAWARTGITFDMARSTASWTLPSHVSMFTGLWPSEHGARVDRAYHLDHPTLAEHLRSRGYATAGVVANVRMCNTEYGVGRGFDHYVDYPWRDEVSVKAAIYNVSLGPVLVGLVKRLGFRVPAFYAYDYQQPAPIIAAKGREWLEANRSSDRDGMPGAGAPFFLFLNFMDVHGPYLPSSEAAGRFWHGPAPTKGDARPEDGWRAVQARNAAVASDRPRRQRDLDAVVRRLGDLYDECLVGLDAELGRFLDGLRDSGLLADTWVIITADHGEHFGEHGHFGHGSTLYNEQTHVPLIVIPPLGDGRPGGDPHAALRGRRIGVPVSLRDLPATMTDVMLGGAPSPFPGHSLARHWRGDRPEAPDPVLSELDQPELKGEDFRTAGVSRMESLIDEDHVLIEYGETPPELFALFDDPAQAHNLAGRADQAGRRRRMKSTLDALHHRNGAGAPAR